MSYEDDDSGRVWVIDTSSIIEVRRLVNTAKAQRAVYERLSALVTEGRLFFPTHVVGELKDAAGDEKKWKGGEDLPLTWAEENAQAATCHGIPVAEVVTVVLPQVGEILDDEKQHEEADPYVLGLAVCLHTKGLSVTVITQEIKTVPIRCP